MKRTFFKRLAAGVATLALLTGTLCTAAFAAVTVNDVKEKTGTGAIHVTVKDQTPATEPGDGTENTGLNGTPVSGVGINALRIGDVVELTTTDDGTVTTQVAFRITDEKLTLMLQIPNPIAIQNSVFYYTPSSVQEAVNNYNQKELEKYLENHKTSTEITDSDGSANFTNLSYGLYLLAKSELPAESTTDLAPFLVSLPMYQESSQTWSGDVYAYPKVRTSQVSITKTSNDTDGFVEAGQTISYTLTATIPATRTDTPNQFTSFAITDTNRDATLQINTNSVQLKIGSSVLTKDTDYTLSYESGALGIVFSSDLSSGLQKLNAAVSSDTATTLEVTYDAAVATNGTLHHELTNTATVTYRRENTAEGQASSAAVNLYTYGINLTKTLSDGSPVTQGAITFMLYNQSGTDKQYISFTQDPTTKNYWKSASGENTLTVGTDGTLHIYGLAPDTYYLEETATQTGYTKLAEPIKIVISGTKDSQSGTVTSQFTVDDGTPNTITDGIVSLTVENTKSVLGFTLPKTGGSGTLLATALGLGLLALAVVLLVLYRKKNREQ